MHARTGVSTNVQIAKRSLVQLKTQEIILIYWVAGGLVMMGAKLGTESDRTLLSKGGDRW